MYFVEFESLYPYSYPSLKKKTYLIPGWYIDDTGKRQNTRIKVDAESEHIATLIVAGYYVRNDITYAICHEEIEEYIDLDSIINS